MSLTSYRTAPPRVTEFKLPVRFRKQALETTSRPARPDGPRKVHRQPAEPRSTLPGRKRESEGGLSLRPPQKTWRRASGDCCDRFGRPGSDLLSRTLRHSTIDAGGLNDRVRNGIGWGPPGIAARSAKRATKILYDWAVVQIDIVCCVQNCLRCVGRRSRRRA